MMLSTNGTFERLILLPVGQAPFRNHPVAMGPLAQVMRSPGTAARDTRAYGSISSMRRIEAINLRVGIGLHVEAVAVLHSRIHAFHKRVPHLPGAVAARIEGNLSEGLLRRRLQQHQRAGGRMLWRRWRS